MIKFNLCIHDWKSYNEGGANWKWFNLPEQESELLDHLDAMNEQGLEEPFICDYEAPFKISEHENINKLIEITYFSEGELLETLDPADNELTEIYNSYELDDYLNTFNDNSRLFYLGKFSNYHPTFQDHWKLDGAGNIQGLTDLEYNETKNDMLQKAFDEFEI